MKTLKDLIDEAVNEKSGGTVAFGLMEEAVKEIETEKAKQAVQVCKDLIVRQASFLRTSVEGLQAIRRQEARAAAAVKKVDRAFRFFKETGNPFPLFLAENPLAKTSDRQSLSFCRELGLTIPEEDSDAWVIPSDWKPKE